MPLRQCQSMKLIKMYAHHVHLKRCGNKTTEERRSVDEGGTTRVNETRTRSDWCWEIIIREIYEFDLFSLVRTGSH